ncbi:MAG: c-type cytochrome [Acidobacteriota bacterium]
MRRRGRCPLPVVAAAALAFPTLPIAAQAAPAGEINYMLYCMGCHVADGSGAPGKVPSLRESLPILAASRAGRRYLIEVPGAAQSPLSDRELAQVLNWMIRTLSATAVPEDFADFTATEVGIYRKSPLVDVRGTRARLLAGPAAATGH